MQINYLHKNVYKLNSYFLRHFSEKKSNDWCVQLVKRWQVLRNEGVSEKICQQIVGISRSSYYRYKGRMRDGEPLKQSRCPKQLRKRQWTENDFQQVLMIRRQNPTYGKEKIHRILQRDFQFKRSQSTVGRILIHAKLFYRATSRCAKQFLLELIKKAPFPIESIQVDGGSEFMKEFEQACQQLNIMLYVLPPKRPQYNGGVERSNRIFREEFYAQPSLANSVAHLNEELKKSLRKYNHYRPHHALQLYTPIEYLKNNYLGDKKSQII